MMADPGAARLSAVRRSKASCFPSTKRASVSIRCHLVASRTMPSQSAQTAKKAAPARKTTAQPVTMAAAMKKAPATVTLKGVFEHLAESLELPKKQANALLDGMVKALTG